MQRALADCQDRDLPQRHSRNQTQLREVPHSTAGIRSALTLNQVDNRSRNAITKFELRRRLTDLGTLHQITEPDTSHPWGLDLPGRMEFHVDEVVLRYRPFAKCRRAGRR